MRHLSMHRQAFQQRHLQHELRKFKIRHKIKITMSLQSPFSTNFIWKYATNSNSPFLKDLKIRYLKIRHNAIYNVYYICIIHCYMWQHSNSPFLWDLDAAKAVKAFCVVIRSCGRILPKLDSCGAQTFTKWHLLKSELYFLGFKYWAFYRQIQICFEVNPKGWELKCKVVLRKN